MRLHLLLLLAIAGLIGLPCAAQAADERESFELLVPVAPTPVATDGGIRIFHELHMTNFSRDRLRPVAVDVRDARTGASLARYEGDALAARLAPAVPSSGVVEASIGPGARAVVYIELVLADGAVPSTLEHRVTYQAGEASPAASVDTTIAVDVRPAAVLGPPLRGGPWAAVFHPDWPRGHRRVVYTVEGRATIPGRFAIDFIRVDGDGRVADGDADLVRNAFGHGEEALAVADATVVATRNDYPETERISGNGRHPLSDGSGNYVVLDLGDGRHAFYEHLRPGSVRVAPGQRVRQGDVIGEVGLSGSGSKVHLHFHVADGPSLLGAEGLPFALTGFSAIGAYRDITELGQRAWTMRAGGVSQRSRERPADNAVVVFPE